MPTRTEIVITFGEIIECLPPGKSRRKRYNSFDANIGNEENQDPSESCSNMKPDIKKVSRKCDDTDDEISFRDVNGDIDHEDGKSKIKRKSNTEKFLEDNANYFQLEVLNTKTRSHKVNEKDVDSDDDSKDGFHTSFLDFLKSKGVSKESGRTRHKSEETESDRERSRSQNGRSKNSFKRYGRSRSSGRSLNGRERSLSRGRSRKKSITDVDGSEVFISESDSECSVRLPRLDVVKSRINRSASPSDCSDTSVQSQRHTRSKSSVRDASPAGSDVDISTKIKNRRSKSKGRSSKSSVRESTPIELNRPRRSSRREVSPSCSDAESLASNVSKTKKDDSEDDDDDDDDDKGKGSPSKRRSNQGRRSELDKLLEAVDTSFHFETAAAERKRLNESGLGPLEIDCSDTGSETSCKVASKRKLNSSAEKSPGRKKFKGSNNLLKTASPGSAIKSEDDIDDLDNEDDCIWDGWDKLNDDIENITDDPVEINKMHFSFESVPIKESWFLTYQRQDRGDEIVFYPSSTTNPFLLPYQMPYSAFLLNRPIKKENETSNEQSKASSPVRESSRKGDKRKISDCESTDSSEDLRRGRGGRPSKLDKVRAAQAHIYENNYRVSPRCHASTKSLGISNQPDIEDLEEAYLFQDERDMGLSSLPSYLTRELARDENSNDSFSSSSASMLRSESQTELNSLAKSLDTMMQDPGDLAAPVAAEPAKVPPTRSRVSSEQLLSPKKLKKKKKVSVDGLPGYEPLDQLVADNIDPVLLDCLEDELPTVPGPLLETVMTSPMDLLETYSSCKSMSVCNSRWLRPNNRESASSAKKEAKNKKGVDPSKPKRLFIYKDDLPGFNFDADMEEEKLPVSSRKKQPKESATSIKKEVKKKNVVVDPSKPKRLFIYKDDLPGFNFDGDMEEEKLPVSKKRQLKATKSKTDSPKSQSPSKEADDSDDDLESVDSTASSTSSVTKKRRKTNKTGFPTPKKKKKVQKEDQPSKDKDKVKKSSDPKASKSPEKTEKFDKTSKKSLKKLIGTKQKKIDDFIVKKGSKSSPGPASSKRSANMQAKNYRS